MLSACRPVMHPEQVESTNLADFGVAVMKELNELQRCQRTCSTRMGFYSITSSSSVAIFTKICDRLRYFSERCQSILSLRLSIKFTRRGEVIGLGQYIVGRTSERSTMYLHFCDGRPVLNYYCLRSPLTSIFVMLVILPLTSL